jgi:tetratricopeptide (TPR) repeat protein
LAKSFSAREEYEKAAKLLDFSLAELDKNNLRVRAERTFVAVKMEDLEAAQEHLELALTLRERDARAQEIQALFLEHQGKNEEAKKILENLVKQRPRRVEAKIQLARMIMETDTGKAKELLDAAMGSVEDIADQLLVSRLYTALGLLEEKAGNIKKAIDFHEKAIVIFKHNSESTASLKRINR